MPPLRLTLVVAALSLACQAARPCLADGSGLTLSLFPDAANVLQRSAGGAGSARSDRHTLAES